MSGFTPGRLPQWFTKKNDYQSAMCNMRDKTSVTNMSMTTTTSTSSKNTNSFCLVRPPSHHAGRCGSTRGCDMVGFCLINNVVIMGLTHAAALGCKMWWISTRTSTMARRSVHLYCPQTSRDGSFFPGECAKSEIVGEKYVSVGILPAPKSEALQRETRIKERQSRLTSSKIEIQRIARRPSGRQWTMITSITHKMRIDGLDMMAFLLSLNKI